MIEKIEKNYDSSLERGFKKFQTLISSGLLVYFSLQSL